MKLRTKIALTTVFASFVLYASILLILFFYLQQNLIEKEILNSKELSVEQVHENVRIFEKYGIFARTLSLLPEIKEYLAKPDKQNQAGVISILGTYARTDSKYLSLYLLDRKGIALVSTDPTFTGNDYSFRDYFKEGMSGRNYADLLLGKTSKQFGYYFSYPVFDGQKNILGVFVAKIDSGEVDSSISISGTSKLSTTMMVDRFGVVVAPNNKGRFLKSLGKLTTEEKTALNESQKFAGEEIPPLQYGLVQDVIRKGVTSQVISFEDVEDSDWEIININKIGNFPFYLVVETGLEAVNETIFNMIIVLSGLVAVALVVIFFIIYYLVIYTLKPLNKLKAVADDIASGEFSKRIDIDSEDEVGDIAKIINKMAEDLYSFYKNIEEKVKERTEKLEQSETKVKTALSEAERINKLMIGRELEMIKLKKELSDLKNDKKI